MNCAKSILASALLALVAAGCGAQGKPAATASAAPSAAAGGMTEDQKALYALGVIMGRNITVFHLNPAELEIVRKGLADQVAGKTPEVDMQTYGQKLQELARTRQMASMQGEKEKGTAFRAAAAKEAGAKSFPSGVVYKVVTAGTGAMPKATDTVKVHYTGKLIDGKVFDSSVQRGQPAEFALNQVVACWTEGVSQMKVGEKGHLVCPPEAAYGDNGSGMIPPGATIAFDVELLDIVAKK